MVIRALQYAADEGLPGAHHFYVTFRTDYPGVQIPARLKQKYPQEMTIVLQHQFRDLLVDKEARRFGVTLSFGGVSATLSVPLEAVSAFVDPSIQYGLRFKVKTPDAEDAVLVAVEPALAAVENQPSRTPRRKSSAWTRSANAAISPPDGAAAADSHRRVRASRSTHAAVRRWRLRHARRDGGPV